MFYILSVALNIYYILILQFIVIFLDFHIISNKINKDFNLWEWFLIVNCFYLSIVSSLRGYNWKLPVFFKKIMKKCIYN
jgi:hypothetical protein